LGDFGRPAAGGAKLTSQRQTIDLDLVLSGFHTIAPNEDIARRAYYLTKTYACSHGVDSMDALIAATALEEGLTPATRNRKHFQMIRDPPVESCRVLNLT
jgi:predicted nucleic acid-binding protein